MKEMADKLKELRIQRGLTQKSMAERLGICASIISAYERDDRSPSLENLVSLAYFFSCTTDYLLGKEIKVPTRTLDVDGLTDDEIQALQNLIQALKNKNT